jgi:hypothetical protein
VTKRLREHSDELEALVGIAAEALRMPSAYIEKDFWVTEVLRSSSSARTVILVDGSTAPVSFTFKGGTSLSRVFGLVERFSEDIDLLAEFPVGASKPARHRVLKAVDSDVRSHLGVTGDRVIVGPSTEGVKRYTTYTYPAASRSEDLKEGVLLELGSRGGSHPSSAHQFRSLIAEHAIAELGEDDSTWEEFATFEINVLSPVRTLFEKLAAVHDAASRNDSAALLKHGRHFYDIHRLVRDEEVIAEIRALGDEAKQRLIDDIEQQSVAAEFPSTPRPESGYASSPAFDEKHVSRSDIELGYIAAEALIYGERVPLEEAMASVHLVRDLL